MTAVWESDISATFLIFRLKCSTDAAFFKKWKPITSFLTKKQEKNNHFPLGSTLTTLPPCRIAPTGSHLPVIDPVSRNQPGCSKLH